MANEQKEKQVEFKYKPAVKFCPKCGSRMGEHSDRFVCGKCGYTEWKTKKE